MPPRYPPPRPLAGPRLKGGGPPDPYNIKSLKNQHVCFQGSQGANMASKTLPRR